MHWGLLSVECLCHVNPNIDLLVLEDLASTGAAIKVSVRFPQYADIIIILITDVFKAKLNFLSNLYRTIIT